MLAATPSLLDVFEGVVESAEQFAFVDTGRSSVGPMVNVVDVAPLRGPLTSRGDTVPVPGDDRPSLCGGPHPGLPADIEDL